MNISLIILGIRLFMALLENAPLVQQDGAVLQAIIQELLAGKKPTPEQLAQLNETTAKLLSAELAAAIASGIIPTKA